LGTNTDPAKIIVNGPYKIENYTPSQRVVFGVTPTTGVKIVKAISCLTSSVLSGKLLNLPTQLYCNFVRGLDTIDLLKISPLKREEKREIHCLQWRTKIQKFFISFNLNKGRRANGQPVVDPIKSRWFNTLAFRQAVAHAIDRQTMLNNVFRVLGRCKIPN